MRRWIGFISLILISTIVGVEISSFAFIKSHTSSELSSPGMAIMSLAFIDGILLYSWLIIKMGFFIPEKTLTPFTKIANLVFFLAMTILAIIAIITAITLTVLMVSLLLSVPFGTIAYVAGFGHFPAGGAHATLSGIMFLKFLFTGSLVIGESRLFEDYRKLLMILLMSFVANILVGFLIAFPPGLLASITDAIGAIIVTIIALIWILFLLLGSIINVITMIFDTIGLISKTPNAVRSDSKRRL